MPENFLIIDKEYMFFREGDLTTPSHLNPELEIVLQLSGSTNVRFDNGDVILSENDAVLIPPYRLHRFITNDSGLGRVYMFSQILIDDYIHLKRNNFAEQLKITVPHQAIEYINYATDKWKNNETVFLSKSLLSVFASEFSLSRPVEVKTSEDSSTLRQITDYISERICDENLTVQSVSDALNISKGSISRLFSDIAGESFTGFIHLVRIEYAKSMLLNSGKTITEIAYHCGFGSLRSFNRIFVAKMNCTPGEFRKHQLQKNTL